MSKITGLAHLRFPGPHGLSPFGGLTVGYDIQPDETGVPKLYLAVAQCHQTDNYNRKVGRAIVEGRLEKVRNGGVHQRVMVAPINEELLGGAVALKQTKDGVYYIDKNDFDLHTAVLNTVVQDVVQAQAAQHPLGQFMEGYIEKNGNYMILRVGVNQENAQAAFAQYAERQRAAANEQVQPDPQA